MKLISNLSRIANDVESAVSLALHDTSDFILTLIRLYAPVDTGALRDSYEIEIVSPLYVLIGSMLNYSVFLEYGSSKASPQSHVAPAFLQAENFFKQRLIERLEDLR